MSRIGRFLRDREGAVTIGSIAIGTSIVSIGAVLAMALSTDITASSTAVPSAEIVSTIDGALQLTDAVVLPVGSVVAHSSDSFTSFELPNGGWLDAWGSHDAIPAGSVLTSPETFTTRDGQTLDAAHYASSVSEAYSSQVKYAFK